MTKFKFPVSIKIKTLIYPPSQHIYDVFHKFGQAAGKHTSHKLQHEWMIFNVNIFSRAIWYNIYNIYYNARGSARVIITSLRANYSYH